MKRFCIFLMTLVTTCALNAQVGTENYIRTRKMLNNTGSSYVDNIAYYDGLGRPFQSVLKTVESGTTKSRLATLQEYDANGREADSWLPVPVSADYVAPSVLKTTATGNGGYNDTHPYSRPVYES